MTIEVKHKFVSQKEDAADNTLIRPSNWNETHQIDIAGLRIVGKATAGQGAAQEISLGTGLEFSGTSMRVTLTKAQIEGFLGYTPMQSGSSPTFGKDVVLSGARPAVSLTDTEKNQTRKLHHADNKIGFLANAGGWTFNVADDGSVWTLQFGDLNTRIFAVANQQVSQINMRRTGQAAISVGTAGTVFDTPAGTVQTGMLTSNNNIQQIRYHYLQIHDPVNGWRTMGG